MLKQCMNFEKRFMCMSMEKSKYFSTGDNRQTRQKVKRSAEKGGNDSTPADAKRPHVAVKYDDAPGEAPGDVPWMPPAWRGQWDQLVEMRRERDAPVDTMGCDQAGNDADTPQNKRYQVLISLMLSSQTKDAVNAAAMQRLKAHGCTAENIQKTPDKLLGELIYPVSFWKTKVVNIKKTTARLLAEFEGDIPDTVEGLCSLNGVGPKMAHLCMKSAWGQVTGIGVDVHVHRITNRLGWVRRPTKTPEDTRRGLEDWLPREKWDEINLLLVGFGQQHCLPVGPHCGSCLLQPTCPTGRKSRPRARGNTQAGQ